MLPPSNPCFLDNSGSARTDCKLPHNSDSCSVTILLSSKTFSILGPFEELFWGHQWQRTYRVGYLPCWWYWWINWMEHGFFFIESQDLISWMPTLCDIWKMGVTPSLSSWLMLWWWRQDFKPHQETRILWPFRTDSLM